ncbi:MAG: hypothetical protein QG632_200 [Candidatus Dependentiae bacterium]|nr:hypothetical protein [Candidatus Dependentiae bacterium]
MTAAFKKILFLGILAQCGIYSLHAMIPWTIASDHRSATATVGPITYTYNLATVLDPNTFTGPLKSANAATNVEWVYNIYSYQQSSLGWGEWHWKNGSQTWTFEIATKQWVADGGRQVWSHTDSDTWRHDASQDTWKFRFAFYPPWEHNITDIANDDTVFTESWEHNSFSGEWTNRTRNLTWTFDHSTHTWTRTSSAETWTVNSLEETVTCTSSGIPQNRWKIVNNNIWIEQVSGIRWQYLTPDVPYSPGNPTSGTWKNLTTMEVWSYDTGTHFWIKEGTSTTTYFPPLTPPLIALQIQTIYDVSYDVQNTVATAPTPPSGDYTWTDGLNTLHSATTDFQMILGGSGISLGRGFRYGFDSSYAFQSSIGERWFGPFSSLEGETFTNQSTNLVTADTITYQAGTDKFWRNETNGTHVWQYHVKDDTWINARSGQRMTFDYASLQWSAENGSRWEYLYTGVNWAWRNHTTNEDWVYTEVPLGQISYIKCWKNLSTGINWAPNIIGTTPVITNRTTSVAYAYNTMTHLWHPYLNPAGPGLDLFPLHPSTMIGYIGFKQHLAITETTSTSPYGSSFGLLQRVSANKEVFNDLQSTFNTLMDSYRGLARYNNLLPFKESVISFYGTNLWLYYEFQSLYIGFLNGSFTPDNTADFPVWLPTRGFCKTVGSAAYKIQAYAPMTMLDTTPISVGLAADPFSGGGAIYALKLGNVTTELDVPPYSITTYRAQVYKGNEILTDQQIFYPPDDGTYLWLTYNNGHVMVGSGDPVTATDIKTLFDYTIEDGDTPSTIQYLTFSRRDPGTPLTIQATPYIPDYFVVQSGAADMFNQCQDCLRIAPLEEIWDEAKEKLIALATTDSSYAAKARRAQEVIDAILGTYTVTKPSTEATSLGSSLQSQNSQYYYNYVYRSYGHSQGAMGQYLTYNRLTTGLEESFTPLLTADPSSLTLIEEQTLIDNVRSAASDIIEQMGANIANLTYSANQLTTFEENADLETFTNFFNEETALLNDLAALLELMDPFVLDRFLQQVALYTNNDTPSQASVNENNARRAAERVTAINLLAERIANGQSTLFSTLTAACIILCINNNFDTIRVQLDSYLTANGYLNAHLFNSPPLSQAAATHLLTTILDVMEPQIDLDGSIFYSTFAGTKQATADPASSVYMQATITTTSPSFTAAVASGNANYLKNTSILTTSDEHVRNVVREVTTPAGITKNETYSRIYIKDANVALGNGNYTQASNNSLSVFGATELTPDGDLLIILNSDITVNGVNFLRPSPDFGSDPAATVRCIPATPAGQVGKNTIIFHADTERTITIASGSTFDLTAFGQRAAAHSQKIIFSGKVKLVLEPNTRLRFPYTTPDELDTALELAFQDDAQLIFQGLDNYDRARWTDSSTGSDLIRTKILGVGKISFSDNASAKLMRSALVSVEADYNSNITDVTVELNNQSSWYIGDTNTTGGGLQIGNIINGGSDNLGNAANYPNNTNNPLYGDSETPFIPNPTAINFTLTLNDGGTLFNIGREGFLGFGVGTVNKDGNINGTLPNATTDPDADDNQFYAWNVQSLFNVGNITLNLLNGTFSHHMVADGTDTNGSLLAFGPQMPRANYKILVNKTKNDIVLCGGNVLFMRAGTVPENGAGEATPRVISIWSTVTPLVGGSTDSGKYSMLAPAALFMLRNQTNVALPGALTYGRATISLGSNIYQFTGPVDEAYLALTFQDFAHNSRYVVAYTTNLQNAIAFVDTSGAIRAYALNKRWVSNRRGQTISGGTSVSQGYLRAITTASTPKKFVQ